MSEKAIGELSGRCDQLAAELDKAQNESRRATAEMFNYKSKAEEINESMEALATANKNLNGEIRELLNALEHSERGVSEAGKFLSKANGEKEELRGQLESKQEELRLVSFFGERSVAFGAGFGKMLGSDQTLAPGKI